MSYIFLADIVNPETGKTYREENNALKHNIPLGTLVEVDFEDDSKKGLRLFVVSHDRDCDGTPLYSLSFDKDWEENMFGEEFKHIARFVKDSGYSESCLKIIK